MSDINIIPDGLIAFVVAAPLCLLLLLATVICFLYERLASRRRAAFRRGSVSPNLFGLSLSLACAIVILLMIILANNSSSPHTLSRWFDTWLWLWAAAVLLAWPVGAYFWKKRKSGGLTA